MRLQTRRQIHLTADYRIIHSIFASKVADCAEARSDSNPQLEGLLHTQIRPLGLELSHASLHGDRHPDAGKSILSNASGVRIAKEGEDGVADIFVDRGAMLEGDLRHF